MLYIEQAYTLFDKIANPEKYYNNNPEKRIPSGVILTNYIDKSFGRTYLRTHIQLTGKVSYQWHEDTYVSYRVWDYKGKELIDEVNKTSNQQYHDVLELKDKIKELLPNTSVHILFEGYGYTPHLKTIFLDDLTTNGQIYELLEDMDDETQQAVNELKSEFSDSKKRFTERKKAMIRFGKEHGYL